MRQPDDASIVLRSERVMLPGGWAAAEVACTAGHIDTIDPIGTHAGAIDLHGKWLVPGYVDIQINGGYGHDFSRSAETIWEVGERLPETGVTAFVPTIITGPESSVTAALSAVAAVPTGYEGSVPLGLHLEGPVLSPENKGAHDAGFLTTDAPVATWIDDRVRIVTLAPELVDAAVIGEVSSRGTVVAIGHTNASYQETVDAFAAGARHMTHLFNAMPPIHHREPGPIVAALANHAVTVAVIPDGIHVHPAVIGLVAQSIGSGRLVAITDAIAAMGMPPGEYRVGPLVAQSDGVTMRLPDGTYAGSLLTMEQAVQVLINEVGLDPVEAIRSASETPSRLLGDESRGAIKPRARADMVILDGDYNVRATVIAGDVVFGELG
jgi:N-acetylglucosamine-6-phosphate deacetylase